MMISKFRRFVASTIFVIGASGAVILRKQTAKLIDFFIPLPVCHAAVKIKGNYATV
jgi:hypothetical protein